MASAFDDHSLVTVLEFTVKRLILNECLRAPNPKAAFDDWTAALRAQSDLIVQFAFSEHARSDDVKLNAISGAGEYDRFVEELKADLADRLAE